MHALVRTSILAMAGAVVLAASPAAAHERHRAGPLELAIGFQHEPAFAGQPNAAEITITRGGKPVTGRVRLDVEVTFGSETIELAVLPGREPGRYLAGFIPTRPGTYTFRFFGRVEGRRIDRRVTSGPETFNDVEDASGLAFPVRDPSAAELADRLERGQARSARESEEAAGRIAAARTIAVVAAVVALLALALALVAILRSRRPAA